MSDTSTAIPQRIWACFRRGPFARYVAGDALSMTGSWMQVMAQGWVMTGLTQSAFMLGLVNFASGIPMLLLALTGGVAADRFSKRNILLWTQVVQIAFALLVGWLVASRQVQVWHIVGVAFFLGVAMAFEFPAVTALVPELVPRDQIATAIAIDRAVFHGTRLIGPALAGLIVSWWTEAAAFFVNAFSFLAFVAALLTLPADVGKSPGVADGGRGGLREGLAYVRSDRPTLAMIALLSLATLFVFPVLVVMLPLYARHLLGLGADRMGLLMGLTAVGSFTGALGLLAVSARARHRLMYGFVGVTAAGLVGLAVAGRFVTAVPCLMALALGVSTLVGLANVVVQERAPSPLRGRVSAIAGMSFFGLMPFASLGITALADGIGMRLALVLGAGAFLGAGWVVLRAAAPRAAAEDTEMPL